MDGSHAPDFDSDILAARLLDIYKRASDAGERTALEALRSAIDNADLRPCISAVDATHPPGGVKENRRPIPADPAYRRGLAEGFAEVCAKIEILDRARAS